MNSLSLKSPTSRRRKTLVAVIVAVLVLGGIGAAYYFTRPTTDKNASDPTNNSAKRDAANQDDGKAPSGAGAGLPKSSTSMTSDQVPISSKLSITITSTSQSDGLVKASAQTSGSGTCVFLYQPSDDGKPVTRQLDTSGNTCSVNISQNEFVYLGQWQLTVTYYSDNSKAEVSRNVTIH